VRRTLVAAVVVLLPLSVISASVQRTDKSAVEGVVLRLGTDAPLLRATVHLAPVVRGPAATGSIATTDAAGRFTFTDLDPGDYRLRVVMNGYVLQEYGQRVFPGQGTPLRLSAGQPLKNIVVRLTPTGTVSGRLIDRSGQPLGNIGVQLMRHRYQYNGTTYEKQLQQEFNTRTNDRGEYRLFFVTPGQYLLAAGSPPNDQGFDFMAGPAGNPFREDVAFAYYPGVSEVGSARSLSVRSGEELSGMDMAVNPPRTSNVRGRVIDTQTGAAPAAPNLSLVNSAGQALQSRAAYTAATGVFEFRNVPEGRYTAVAGTVAPPIFTGREEPTPPALTAAFAPLNVAGVDIDGLVLTLNPGFTVSGRVRIEPGAGDSTPLDFGRLSIAFSPVSESAVPYGTNQVRFRPESRVDAAGSFRVDRVWDTSYRVAVNGLPEGWFIKQARLGAQDILAAPLSVSRTPQDILEIVVSSKSAEIQVTAADGNARPIAGAQVVLVPATARDRMELFKSGNSDSNGRVTLRSVVPGDYILIAWEALESYAWIDPDVLKGAEASATKLSIAESARITTTVRVIPAP
jgi:hypothetical protein